MPHCSGRRGASRVVSFHRGGARFSFSLVGNGSTSACNTTSYKVEGEEQGQALRCLQCATPFTKPMAMSQRFVFHEDSQVPARIMRAVIWSPMMAFLWTVPLVILTLTIYQMGVSHVWLFEYLGTDNWMRIFVISVYAVLWAVTSGSTAGLGAAFCAQHGEPYLPFLSPTFRVFAKRMVLQSAVFYGMVILECYVGLNLSVHTILMVLFALAVWREVSLQCKRTT